MTAASPIDWAGANYARQVDEIRAEVEKRFWVLRYDEQLKWHYVEDAVGVRHRLHVKLCRADGVGV